MKGSYEDRSPWNHVAFGTIAHFKTDARSPSQLRGLNLILIDGLAHAADRSRCSGCGLHSMQAMSRRGSKPFWQKRLLKRLFGPER